MTPTRGWIPFALAAVSALAPAQRRPAPVDACDFAVRMHRELARDGGDVACSPTSIRCALALVRAGATGETRAEIDAALAFSGDDRELARALNGRLAELVEAAARSTDSRHGDTFEFSAAHGVWVDRRITLQSAWRELVTGSYGAGVDTLDFAGAPDRAVAIIEGWVRRQTADRIKDLVTPDLITPDTRLVLASALRCGGGWEETVHGPHERAFRLADGEVVQVPFLLAGGALPLVESAGWQAVAMHVRGGRLALGMALPAGDASLAECEAALTGVRLAALIDALRAPEASGRPVSLEFPKFATGRKVELEAVLQRLGVRRAFTAAAEFDALTSSEALAVDRVVHDARVTVDEHGLTAAAATVVTMKRLGLAPGEPLRVSIDRPFLFFVYDRASGEPLFVGRIADPRD